MKTGLSIEVVETNGTIDQHATQENLTKELAKLQNERTARQEGIAMAVTAIFDRFPGGRVNLPDLTTMILVELRLSPSTYGSWRPAILAYIRDNCQGEQNGNQVERPESMLLMHRGKDGGVARRGDLKVAAQGEKEAA